MTRLVASGVLSAVLLGLIPAEKAALVLAALALVVSGSAYAIATSAKASLKDAIDQQSTSARALEAAAAHVDSRLRDPG